MPARASSLATVKPLLLDHEVKLEWPDENRTVMHHEMRYVNKHFIARTGKIFFHI